MIKLKLDLTKLTGAQLMQSKSGKPILVIDLDRSRTFQGKTGAVYADLCLIELKEEGKYGDTHFIAEDVSKEERADGVKGNIVGNGKTIEQRQQSRPQQSSRQPQRQEKMDDVFPGEEEEQDIPF